MKVFPKMSPVSRQASSSVCLISLALALSWPCLGLALVLHWPRRGPHAGLQPVPPSAYQLLKSSESPVPVLRRCSELGPNLSLIAQWFPYHPSVHWEFLPDADARVGGKLFLGPSRATQTKRRPSPFTAPIFSLMRLQDWASHGSGLRSHFQASNHLAPTP